MVDGVVADVPNLRASTLERRRGVFLVVAVGRDSNASDGSRGRLRGKPDNDVLPVVAVAETS